jgi:hypothetical protein
MKQALYIGLVLVAAAIGMFAAPGAAEAKGRTVWLCKPGLDENPCKTGQATTLVSPSGDSLRKTKSSSKKPRKADCFYVYPTVSGQPTPNANRDIDPELNSIALYQAARFSQTCRVFTPVYRQITLGALGGVITDQMRETAYADVRRAFRQYLRKYNQGRGFVLLGHSQGTFMLRQLASEEVDRKRAVRRKLISAILLGGDVTVREGSDRGGDFRNIRACRSADQLRCVIAFSTYDEEPPAESRFGRTTEPGLEVLCTDPAALSGGSGTLRSAYPTAPFAPGTLIGLGIALIGVPASDVSTPWVEFRGAFSGECSSAGGADVLRVESVPGAPDIKPSPDANWGLHLVDGNIALGNLIKIVRKQIRAFS